MDPCNRFNDDRFNNAAYTLEDNLEAARQNRQRREEIAREAKRHALLLEEQARSDFRGLAVGGSCTYNNRDPRVGNFVFINTMAFGADGTRRLPPVLGLRSVAGLVDKKKALRLRGIKYKKTILGAWERDFICGRVTKREGVDVILVVIYEPWSTGEDA